MCAIQNFFFISPINSKFSQTFSHIYAEWFTHEIKKMFASSSLIRKLFILSGSRQPQQIRSGDLSDIVPRNQSHKNHLRRLKRQKLRDIYRQHNQSDTGNNLLLQKYSAKQ